MNLDQLAAALDFAKAKEMHATAQRIEAENALIELLGAKDEGSQTHKGTNYKVTITGNVYRTVDRAALDAVRSALSPAIFEQVFRFKPEVITAGVRYLMLNEASLYAIAAQAITATPGKSSVRVEAVEQLKEAA
jgi:hypothetical protein